jgi:hypothetical protein
VRTEHGPSNCGAANVSGQELKERIQDHKWFFLRVVSNGKKLRVRTLNGFVRQIEFAALSGEKINVKLDRPFRDGELGYPYLGQFHETSGNRQKLFELLKLICEKKHVKNAKQYGLTSRQVREIVRYAKPRFALYHGSCDLASLYPVEANS